MKQLLYISNDLWHDAGRRAHSHDLASERVDKMQFDQYVNYWAQTRGNKLFMTFEDQQMSWSQLDQAAGSLASHLIALGARAGDRVGCLLPNGLEWCVTFAAAIRIGAIMVPLNCMFGRFELDQIATDAECAAIVSIPSEIAKLGIVDTGPDRVACYDLRGGTAPRAYADIMTDLDDAPRSPAGEDDVLAICYTSGTTGIPKGIMLTHGAVERMTIRVAQKFGWRFGEERFLILAPLAFTGGIISNLAAMIQIGGSGWLERSVDPERALRALIDHRITHLGGVPALWERVAAAPAFEGADLSALRAAGTGGAPVPLDLLHRYAAKGVIIRQQYGASENCGTISCPDEDEALARPHACGRPVPGVLLEIRDETGRAVSNGEVGEICILSDQIMKGYWRQPEATSAAFDGLWYKTGDLARLDEHGAVVVVDRKKNMLISGGVNIYPAEVERGLMQINGVLETVVLGRPSTLWGQEVVAIVHAPNLDRDAISAEARAILGSVKAPKTIIISPGPLPRTVSGKIARTGLQELHDRLTAPVPA